MVLLIECSISNEAIDQVTADLLQNGGVATLELPPQLTQIHSDAFRIATQALNVASESAANSASTPGSTTSIPVIEPNSNAAFVTGYHSAGGENSNSNSLSRYNVHREGFVFSNGESFDIPLSNDNNNNDNDSSPSNTNASFEQSMNDMFESMCNVIAKDVLRGIARHLKIEEDWFHDTYGPMDLSSQWHIKRYTQPNNNADDADAANGDGEKEKMKDENIHSKEAEKDIQTQTQQQTQQEEEEESPIAIEWLPIHTDPSLISIIIHDAPGTNPLAMGLEYQAPPATKGEQRVWKEVGWHGHAVATVFCGSVMSYITGGLFQSAKHRVMYTYMPSHDGAVGRAAGAGPRHRQAATLFLRPQGESVLTVPPSPLLVDTERIVKIRKNCRFEDWLNRVSRNYQGGGSSKSKKSKSKGKGMGKEKKKQTLQNGNSKDAKDDTTRTRTTTPNVEELAGAEEESVRYKFGNATLRSSTHTLRYSKSRPADKGPNTGNHKLPPEIRQKYITSYDSSKCDLRNEVLRMLLELDPELIGEFQVQRVSGEDDMEEDEDRRLEHLSVPPDSLLPLKKSKAKNGKGELAQRTLSDSVVHDSQFHDTFDKFVCEEILPGFKQRLIACDAIPANEPAIFYYQRPPTLRIQPGPSARGVPAHSDATYGHQDGELNFWMPLTDPDLTKTDLWSESRPGKGDYSPLGPKVGEVVAFHGSSCKHYVPANKSNFTRVSLDFRIGVEPYFDSNWTMLGTIKDHARRKVIL